MDDVLQHDMNFQLIIGVYYDAFVWKI